MNKNTFWYIVIAVAGVFGALVLGPMFAQLSGGTFLLLFILIFGGIGALIWYNLSANKGAGPADGSMIASAEAMQPASGMGRIYITRTGFAGSLQGMNIDVSGVGSGQIKSKQYLMAEVAPGAYTIHAQMARSKEKHGGTIEVNVAEGQCVGVHALMEMGAMAGTVKLTPKDEAGIRADIASSKLIRWNEA